MERRHRSLRNAGGGGVITVPGAMPTRVGPARPGTEPLRKRNLAGRGFRCWTLPFLSQLEPF